MLTGARASSHGLSSMSALPHYISLTRHRADWQVFYRPLVYAAVVRHYLSLFIKRDLKTTAGQFPLVLNCLPAAICPFVRW
jgi:hypothetical protein